MGNVLAASQPPGTGLSPPGSMPPPPPPTVGIPPGFIKPEASDTKTQESPDSVNGVENPGSMEELHRKCKEVFPITFEGAKLMVNKGLSNHFQVSHTINLSGITPSCYRFGATYVGTKQISPSEAFPILLGDIDPSGNMNANIIHQFGQRIRSKLVTQIQSNKFNAAQWSTEYRGDDFTGTLTMGNIDIINESGIIVTQFLQSVTPSIALGSELAYQYGSNVPGGEIALLTLAARYTGSDNVTSGTVGTTGLHLCYYQKASEQLQIGVELETNFRMQESVASIGYQVDLPKADLSFKGMIDTNWTVGAVLEKKLQPLPFSFALSGILNHSRNQFRLGCGLIIG